jgi:hypothetical protein
MIPHLPPRASFVRNKRHGPAGLGSDEGAEDRTLRNFKKAAGSMVRRYLRRPVTVKCDGRAPRVPGRPFDGDLMRVAPAGTKRGS